MTDTAHLPRTSIHIILACAACHLINDMMQSLLTSIYPMLKADFALDFLQIGLLTFAFQITASILQPLIGAFTDRWPLTYGAPAAMVFTCLGLLTLAYATDFGSLLLGASLVGIGSSIFHPETSRISRMAAGRRIGFAQSLFQVGGNTGAALGPLLAVFIVLPKGQSSLALLAMIAALGFVILVKLGRWAAEERNANKKRQTKAQTSPYSRRKTLSLIAILVLLTAGKQTYLSSLSSYLTFYSIEKFDLSLASAQYLLFLFLGASALGVFFGGPFGDLYDRRLVIWISVLGVIPLALLLPFANLFWSCCLIALIGVIFSSAFPAIVVFAQELLPNRIGLVSGLFFGFAFGFGGLGAAGLGALADATSLSTVYWICAFIPVSGLVALALPKLPAR